MTSDAEKVARAFYLDQKRPRISPMPWDNLPLAIKNQWIERAEYDLELIRKTLEES